MSVRLYDTQLKTPIGFVAFVSWSVNDFFKNIGPSLSAPAQCIEPWDCSALVVPAARCLALGPLWWSNSKIMILCIRLLFFFHSGWGQEREDCAEVHQEADFMKQKVKVVCRCVGALSWLWYLQNGVGHQHTDLVWPHPAKDSMISCLQKHTQNLF